MPRLSAADAVSPAMERARSMLVPFRLKTWLKMGFIGWLAGELAGGANMGGRIPAGHTVPVHSGGGMPGIHMPQQILLIIGIVVAFLLVVGIIFAYLFSRFRFVLFDSVLKRDIMIGRGWQLYGPQAGRYFGFWLLFGLLGFVCVTGIIGIPLMHAWKAGVFQHGFDDLQPIFMLLGSVFLGLFLFGLAFFILSTLAKDFLVPLMALDNLSVSDAWVVLKNMGKAEPGAFLGYIGLKFVLYLAAIMLFSIVLVIAALILAIPVAIIAITVFFVAKAAGALAISLGIVGALAIGTLFALLAMVVSAPFCAFFASYSLYFFGGRYPKLGALLWPETPLTPQPTPAVLVSTT
jgi:hypothetical protein